MTKLPSQSNISNLLDLIGRDKFVANHLGEALGALIYLRWADFQEAEQEAIAAFDDTHYNPVLPPSMHWRSWHALPPNELKELFTHRLFAELESLNNLRNNSLATHLHRIASPVKDLSRLSSQLLKELVRWLADQPFETPGDRRALLSDLDSVLDKALDKYSGEFRTPASVTNLLVELAAPAAGDRIYDPCFGSGNLLTAAIAHVLRQQKEPFSRSGTPSLTISGVERNLNAYVIGLTRLALAGVDNPQLELGNSLERTPPTSPQRDGFDVILASPPLGMRTDLVGLDHFPVRTSDVTGLFIQHALSYLRPDGRAVVIVPQGFLFRSGPEQRLRRFLVEQHTVEAVVALPATVFMPYTAVRTSALVLRRGGPTKRIRMIDADPFFEKGKGRQPATIRNDQAEELGQAVRAPQPSKNGWDVEGESLAEVDWDLSPLRRDLSGLIVLLNGLRGKIPVLPLTECCQVIVGRSIKSADLLDDTQGNERIPYVRIKDVQRGQAVKGSSWLSVDTVPSMDTNWKLRAGDVLLSKSGTIGKAGIVRNGAVGAIAANGLFVLRPDQDRLDPHFLLAYLESSECRAWFEDRARGATIRHLSKLALDELPVPLPPPQIQQRVAAEHRENGLDALAILVDIMIEGERDDIAFWIANTVPLLLSHINDNNAPLDLTLWDRIAKDIRIIRNKAVHNRLGENPLVPWVLKFNEAISGLAGIRNIPRGPSLLSVLQETAQNLRDALQTIKGQEVSGVKAINLTMLALNSLDIARTALLADVKLFLSTDTESLRAGEMVTISLQVHNQGVLPLRHLRITTTPDWGHGEFEYFAENTKVIVNLNGAGPKTMGIFTLLINWSGLKLDGEKVDGSREIALNVVEPGYQFVEGQADFGGSPYVCGDPVRPERNDVFFGREELLDQIRRQIIHSGNVVLLEGNRRSGKSSILWHLEGPKAVPGWMGVYCSLQGAEGTRHGAGVPTVEVFREISKSIAKSLQSLGGETPLPDGTTLPPGTKLGITKACRKGISDESAFSDCRDYIEVALEKLAESNLGLLLMLDEFDKIQEGIDSGVTSPQVPENIRFIVHRYRRFSAILTGSRRLKRLREEYWSALFGLGTRFGISSLPPDAARRLVTEPVKDRLTYTEEAVERAITLTAGHPYLLQCLCSRVFDLAARLKTRSVKLDLVDHAVEILVKDNEHFASLWDYAKYDRRRLILALCHRESLNHDPLRFGVIQEKLISHGIEVADETLVADLEYLRELELIDLSGGSSEGNYVLTIPMMGMWIEKHQDFPAIRAKARLESEDTNV